MILPDLILPKRANQQWQYTGMDHPDNCLDKNHFQSYPHHISYNYNSRGFRDQEWPVDITELKEAVWCIGDSFTAGVGSSLEFTWPQRLSVAINKRTINVSMDGASNEWIARIAQRIMFAIDPAHMVIMWSHTHRREHNNALLNDEQRRIQFTKTTVQEDLDNLLACKQQVDSVAKHVVNFAIPGAHHGVMSSVIQCWNNIRGPSWPAKAPATVTELLSLSPDILLEIKDVYKCLDEFQTSLAFKHFLKTHNITLVHSLDVARDGHHFDKITADWVVQQVVDYCQK